jgi:predicted small lipoprotein YifL
MVRSIQVGFLVMRWSDRILPRVAVIGVLVAALGLAGCGRKGGLDAPPGSANIAQEPVAPPEPGVVPDTRPALAPPPATKRRTPIDWLIN